MTPAELVAAIVTEVGDHRLVRIVAPGAGAKSLMDLDRETAVVLERFGFDEQLFESLRPRVAAAQSCRPSRI